MSFQVEYQYATKGWKPVTKPLPTRAEAERLLKDYFLGYGMPSVYRIVEVK